MYISYSFLIRNYNCPRPIFPVGPQPRISNIPCRTLIIITYIQYSLPDLIPNYPHPIFSARSPRRLCHFISASFPAGPPPRPSTPGIQKIIYAKARGSDPKPLSNRSAARSAKRHSNAMPFQAHIATVGSFAPTLSR